MRIEGLEQLDKIIDIDQSPIGRTPRSNPATYTDLFAPIRDWFAELPSKPEILTANSAKRALALLDRDETAMLRLLAGEYTKWLAAEVGLRALRPDHGGGHRG